MSAGFVSIRHVTKRFGAVTAVDDATLEIGQGEFFSLLGPSGCGKTTLLRMIAGFEFPDKGTIAIDGANVTELAPNLRPTNMVFQSYAIFPHLDVFDNIAYGLRKERLAKQELARRVEEMLALVRLEGFGARRSDELSGGQRQRVALARALVKRPKVLLLDEPLGALDRRLREAMQVELRALQKNVGITFVFVTHDQEEALSMSDRVAVMSAGHILQVDSPRALYDRPGCREVADFIGTMNFFEGLAKTSGANAEIDGGALGVLRANSSWPAGAKVLLAVRPEKIAIALGTRPAADNVVKGVLDTATYLGERSHFHVRVAGLSAPVVVAANVAVTPGSEVWLSWGSEAVVVLEG